MQLYIWTNQRSAALRHYQNLVCLLNKELGVPPSEETQALHRAIMEDKLPAPAVTENPPELLETGNGLEVYAKTSGPPEKTQQLKPKTPTLINNLPAQTKSFVGREAELSALNQMLADPGCRLLTLVGPGGVGKTQLAIEAASRQLETFVDGVYFVPLASFNTPDSVASAIADATNLSFHGPGSLTQHLTHFLKEKQVLLILDEVEQLLTTPRVDAVNSTPPPGKKADSLTLFSDLLQTAPHLKLLVTSRERLHLQGEWSFEIQGLPLPPLQPGRGFENYSAVVLFLQYARRVWHNFSLTPAERPAVARICQLVDGLPLGLELAAAWTHLLSCTEIAQEIEHNLDFLVATDRDVPVRQRSLRAVFEHSWNLLSAEEQQALSRLSVFKGGFTREAAQHVAGASLTTLAALVEKSLLYRLETGRYTLHELVRQFSAGYLANPPREPAATNDRHCAYYATLLQQNQPLLRGSQQTFVLSTLTQDIDNLRAAWDWAIRQQNVADLNRAAEGLAIFYDLYGRLQEGAVAFERAAVVLSNIVATNPNPDNEFAYGRILVQQGWFAMRRGHLELSQSLLEQSLPRLEAVDPSSSLAEAWLMLGLVAQQRGTYAQARDWLNQSLALCRRLDFTWGEAFTLYALGVVATIQGYLEEAAGYLDESLRLCQITGDPRMTSLCLNIASAIPRILGRYNEAEQLLQQSMRLHNGKSDRFSLGTTMYHLGTLCTSRGDYTEAQTFLDESLSLFIELGDYANILRALNSLGQLAYEQSNYAAAQRYYSEALQQGLTEQFMPEVLDVLAGVAELMAKMQRLEIARDIATCLLQHPAGSKDTQNRAGQLLSRLSTQPLPDQITSNCVAETCVNELADEISSWLSTQGVAAGERSGLQPLVVSSYIAS